MTKALVAAISALALIQIATPAVARPNDLVDQRIEHLLRQLMTKDASTPAVALVTRAASIQVQGTIKRLSAIKLPLTCTLNLFDRNGHNEDKTVTVTFAGTVGTCNMTIPFKWTNADPASELEAFVTVSNESSGIFSTLVTVSDTLRTSGFNFPPIPLPAQGTTTPLTFDIRM